MASNTTPQPSRMVRAKQRALHVRVPERIHVLMQEQALSLGEGYTISSVARIILEDYYAGCKPKTSSQ